MTIEEFREVLSTNIDFLKGKSDLECKALERIFALSDELLKTYGPTKPSYMTHLQLAELLSLGYGQVRDDSPAKDNLIMTSWTYFADNEDEEVPETVRIRQWGSDKWVEPTADVYEEFVQNLPYSEVRS